MRVCTEIVVQTEWGVLGKARTLTQSQLPGRPIDLCGGVKGTAEGLGCAVGTEQSRGDRD